MRIPAIEVLFERFAKHQGYKGRSPETIGGYQRDLRLCLKWIGRRWKRPPGLGDLTADRMQRYLSHNHFGPRTQERKRAALRTFFEWLTERQFIAADPTALLVIEPIPRRLPRFLTVEQAGALVEAPSHRPSQGPISGWLRVRDRALLELLNGAGPRPIEIERLKMDQILLDTPLPGDVAFWVRGKRDKERVVLVCGPIAESIRAYLACRDKMLIAGHCASVFLSILGRRLSRRAITETVHRYDRQVGLWAFPRLLRHTFATHVSWAGSELAALQDFLGHDDPRTTRVYLHTDLVRLRDMVASRHPRAQPPGTKLKTPLDLLAELRDLCQQVLGQKEQMGELKELLGETLPLLRRLCGGERDRPLLPAAAA